MKNALLIPLIAICLCATYQSGISQLIISQYTETETGSTPKGIELWNVSGAEIDFSSEVLEIEVGFNGAAPANEFTLNSDYLLDGGIMVIGTADMASAVGATSPCKRFYVFPFTFNGDDAIVIKLDGNIVDVFGTPGDDPGSEWSGSGVSTQNRNIKLQGGIITGDTDGWTDPSERFVDVGLGSDLTDFGLDPGLGTCDLPLCGIDSLQALPYACSMPTIGDTDVYDLVITYVGTDTAAYVEYVGGGNLDYGGNAGDLDGSDILISSIPETEDWLISIAGNACSIELGGPAPTNCSPFVNVDSAGNVGIGTLHPTAQLHTTGTVRFSNYGMGSLTTDANGNLSVSSDIRLKSIDAPFERGIDDLLKVEPIYYHWNPETGYDIHSRYAGFSAQNVQSAIPEAVGQTDEGLLTLSDRPIIAALVNAVKELKIEIDLLKLENEKLQKQLMRK